MLCVLARKLTVAQAANQAGVSKTTIVNWKRQFIEAGRGGLASGSSRETSGIEQLRAENKELTARLRDARVLLRVWRMSAHKRDRGAD